MLERLLADPRKERHGPRALVVAPTRELAAQIQAEIDLLGRFTRIRSTVVFGGVGQGAQVRALASKPEILVACPGRLLDLLQQRAVSLDSVEVLVLDEADHMFDMGFLPDLRRILRALPERRQNLLFSATMPREIRGLADDILDRPKVVELGHSTPASTIEHALYPVASNEDKVRLLQHLLSGEDFASAIVFLRTKHRAKRLAVQLAKAGHAAIALQGNMSQGQRERAMQGFRAGRYDVLVATDIAARGIDVSDISHVINFDVPNTPDAYTHRIGRTGRSEKSGKAFTFVTREDNEAVRAIERRIGAGIPRLDASDLLGRASGRNRVVLDDLDRRPSRSNGRRTAGSRGNTSKRQPARRASIARRPVSPATPAAPVKRAEPEIPFGVLERPPKLDLTRSRSEDPARPTAGRRRRRRRAS